MCPREEGEHRREATGSIPTPSNDECLEMSNIYFVKSHLGGRKSSTGVMISVSWQLGKFLDKAFDIVPATKLVRMMFLMRTVKAKP